MRISTNEFLLGSLNDLLAQQSRASQLNRQISTGQTMLDATGDPAGAGDHPRTRDQAHAVAGSAARPTAGPARGAGVDLHKSGAVALSFLSADAECDGDSKEREGQGDGAGED